MEIIDTTADDERVKRLIAAHKEFCVAHTPPGSGHAVTITTLGIDEIRYWLALSEGDVLGCIGLQAIDPRHAEIKTLHVVEQARGKGTGAALIQALVAFSQTRNYERLSLETGKSDGFAPSRRLYAREGFEACEPFGPYIDDPFSFCMTKTL